MACIKRVSKLSGPPTISGWDVIAAVTVRQASARIAQRWLADGFAGEMSYLADRVSEVLVGARLEIHKELGCIGVIAYRDSHIGIVRTSAINQ